MSTRSVPAHPRPAAFVLAAAGALACMLVAAPRAQAAEATPSAYKEVGEAKWVSLPSGSDIAALYPSKAASDKVSGFAMVHCRVMDTGELTHCEPTVESPAGFGFAEATVRMSHHFRLAAGPYAPDATLDIPFRWSLR